MKWRSQPLACPFSADATAPARPRGCTPSAGTDNGKGTLPRRFYRVIFNELHPSGHDFASVLVRTYASSDLDSKNKCDSKHTDKIHTNASVATPVPYLLSLLSRNTSHGPHSSMR